MHTTKTSTKNLVLVGILTALVIILQYVSLASRSIGLPFSISLALIPIIIGSAVAGPKAGAWLGLVCGGIVLATDAGAFLAVDVGGTIITVLAKGILCGYLTGVAYQVFKRINSVTASFLAAIVCPVVNTGIFLIGCRLFFWDTLIGWAGDEGVVSYIIFTLVGINFIVELITNLVLCPAVIHLIKIKSNKSY